MRFVETVASELFHLVEDFASRGLWMAQGCGSTHETVALLSHLFGILFAHRSAEQVGLSERIAGQDVGDLHHLFLINDHAQRLFENALDRSEEHTSELQSLRHLVCRLLLEKY